MTVQNDPNWAELYSAFQVQEALNRMAAEITAESSRWPLTLIAILKGGLWTSYHLLNRLAPHFSDIRIGHMGLSSYGDSRTPGKMKVTHTLDLGMEDVQGTNVWIVDDIWDTGRTMEEAIKRVQLMDVVHVSTATLVLRNKESQVLLPDQPTVFGLNYGGSGFLAGCGMGVGELDRHHPQIYVEVKDE